MWIVAGVKTLGITGSTFKNCAPITNATLQGLCGDAQTLVIFALLSAGICEYRLSALSGYMCGVPLWRVRARDVRVARVDDDVLRLRLCARAAGVLRGRGEGEGGGARLR